MLATTRSYEPSSLIPSTGMGWLWIVVRLVSLCVLFALGVAAILLLVGILPASTLSFGNETLGGWLSQAGDLPLNRRVTIAAATALVVIGLGLALSRRKRTKSTQLHLLAADDHGVVVVETRGIAAVATQAALRTRGIVQAKVRVAGNGSSPVRLELDLGMYPGTMMTEAANDARENAREVVETMVGVPVAEVVARVWVMEASDFHRRVS